MNAYRNLCADIIARAIWDYRKGDMSECDECGKPMCICAKDFLMSHDLEVYADYVGIKPEFIRENVLA